jgi:enterochelin esterase-like enzyme
MDVIPYVRSRYTVSTDPKDQLLAGFSDGASWALAFGTAHSDEFVRIGAFSLSEKDSAYHFQDLKGTTIYMGGGAYEPETRKHAENACTKARLAGAECNLMTLNSGHDQPSTDYYFSQTLEKLFPY